MRGPGSRAKGTKNSTGRNKWFLESGGVLHDVE